MSNLNKYALVAVLTTAAEFSYLNGPHIDIPRDLRDAPNAGNALEQVGYDKGGNIPVPAPSLGNSFPIVYLTLDLQHFKGGTGEDTKRNVDDFVAQLGKKTIDYQDYAPLKVVQVVSGGDRDKIASLLNKYHIESALEDLPEVRNFRYDPLPGKQSWDVIFNKTLYRDRIEKLFAPMVQKYGIQLKYVTSLVLANSGDLVVEVLAEPTDTKASVRQLSVRFPGIIKDSDLYLLTKNPDGRATLSLLP
ncbi:MAG: hypothetical protein NTY45_01105 [Elusimicrobia bacterium]|nr:hypothetical protein [Elusimicrobiota bacterium]